jgi:hypothetical protein
MAALASRQRCNKPNMGSPNWGPVVDVAFIHFTFFPSTTGPFAVFLCNNSHLLIRGINMRSNRDDNIILTGN